MRTQLLSLLIATTVAALPQNNAYYGGAKSRSTASELGIRRELEPGPSRPAFRIRTDKPIQVRANQLIPVVVGGAQDVFVPNMVVAAVGDVVQFQFSQGNHTVTQSAQGSACQPLQATQPGAIHSGHIPFQEGQTTVGTFNMPVTSTEPMFLYCATGPHCIEGQVLVINPQNVQQVVDYAKLATAAAANVDGMVVAGGTVGQIPLAIAAFVPPPAQQAGPPPPAAPAAAPPA